MTAISVDANIYWKYTCEIVSNRLSYCIKYLVDVHQLQIGEQKSQRFYLFYEGLSFFTATFLQQLCISHDEVQRFEQKSLQNDDITL